MSSAYDRALDHPSIRVVDSDPAKGIFEIRLGPLKTVITIDVGLYAFKGRPDFLMTHALHTPLLSFPYKTSATVASTRAEALRKAIRSLTVEYDLARQAGHKPRESWLVPWHARERSPSKIWLRPKNRPQPSRY